MFNHAASNQDLLTGVARAEFMLIGVWLPQLGVVLIFVPESSLKKLEPMLQAVSLIFAVTNTFVISYHGDLA